MDNITKVLLSITTVALVATVVVNGANSAKVVSCGRKRLLQLAERSGEGLTVAALSTSVAPSLASEYAP